MVKVLAILKGSAKSVHHVKVGGGGKKFYCVLRGGGGQPACQLSLGREPSLQFSYYGLTSDCRCLRSSAQDKQ